MNSKTFQTPLSWDFYNWLYPWGSLDSIWVSVFCFILNHKGMGSIENLTTLLVPHSYSDHLYVVFASGLDMIWGHCQRNIRNQCVFHGHIFPESCKDLKWQKGAESILPGNEIDPKFKLKLEKKTKNKNKQILSVNNPQRSIIWVHG